MIGVNDDRDHGRDVDGLRRWWRWGRDVGHARSNTRDGTPHDQQEYHEDHEPHHEIDDDHSHGFVITRVDKPLGPRRSPWKDFSEGPSPLYTECTTRAGARRGVR